MRLCSEILAAQLDFRFTQATFFPPPLFSPSITPSGGPHVPRHCTSPTPRFLNLATPRPPCPASPSSSRPSKTPFFQDPPRLPGMSSQSAAMALEDAAVQAVDPSQILVVAAAAVALEARRSAATMRKRRNEADLASTLVHVQRLREENRRPNTRSTYSKCWRLWRVSAGP